MKVKAEGAIVEMSAYVSGWVLRCSEVDGPARWVLYVLADHASSDGTNAWPSVETIQRETRLKSRRTVQQALRRLEDLGAIVCGGEGPNGTRNYTVVMTGPEGGASDARGASHDMGGRISQHGGGASHAPEPTTKPTTEPSSSAREPQEGLLPSPEQQVWRHYQQTVAGADRRSLDSTRRTCIARALKVRTVDECCKAIDALAASSFHNGENPQGKKYLDVQYALGQKSESPDARIDKWIEESESRNEGTTVSDLLNHLSSESRTIVQQWMRAVEAYARSPESPGVRLTAEQVLPRLARVRIFGTIEGDSVRWEKREKGTEGGEL